MEKEKHNMLTHFSLYVDLGCNLDDRTMMVVEV
jgi:hypothetical protein